MWCTASTTSPRRTVTLIASTEAGAYVARVARGRSLAPPARPASEEGPHREGGAGPHRHAEDVRPAGLRARRGGLQGGRAAGQALPAPDGRRGARDDGAPMSAGRLKYVPPQGKGAKSP